MELLRPSDCSASTPAESLPVGRDYRVGSTPESTGDLPHRCMPVMAISMAPHRA